MLTLLAKAAVYRPNYDANYPPSLPGSGQQRHHVISPEHCKRYNNLVAWQAGESNKIHPNYIQTLTLPMQLSMMTQSPFPFKAIGLVHLANRINVFELPECTDAVTLKTYFGKVYSHKRGYVFEMHSDATHSGSAAVNATSYYLARTSKARHFDDFPEFNETALLQTSCVEVVSTEVSELPRTLTQFSFGENSGRQYASVSGDYNPIHLWSLTSRLFGFKRAIAHGMFSHALVLSALQQAQEVDLSRNVSIGAVFKHAIMLPETTQCIVTSTSTKDIGFKLCSDDPQHPKKAKLHLNGCISPFNI
jgi:hypothetical protein